MDQLLSTKLNIPPRCQNLVSRPRLLQRMNASLNNKLTLISAPAGFGKTTLISEWVRENDLSTAWVSLDDGDNDLTRFLRYIIAALQTVDDEIGTATLDLLSSSHSNSLESILTQLINEVSSIPDPMAVIIDDYQVIDYQSIHDAVCFLIEHIPHQVQVVIASRIDPPLPIAQLRARGQLIELREADLQFTPDETTTYLTEEMGLKLGKSDLETLAAKTEGWIASLQLAAISIKDRTDTSDFIVAFSGRHEFIVDYLTDEVLKKLPKGISNFLLQTSILKQLTAGLCNKVTGLENGQSTLETLQKNNLFVISLDNERQWFRYHALFAEMLRKRLIEEQADLIPVLHRRAAQWYERHGQSDLAIHHALEAEDYDHASSIVERIAEEILVRSELKSLLKWVDALPKEIVKTRPHLMIYYAFALMLSGGDLENVELIIQDALNAGDRKDISGEVSAIQALIATLKGDFEKSIMCSHHAMEALPLDNIYLRSLVINNLGMAYVSAGDVDAAHEMLTAAAKAGELADNYMSMTMALRRLAEVSFISGDLYKIIDICKRGQTLSVYPSGKPLPVVGLLMDQHGIVLREWNELKAADQYIQDGIELVLKWSEYMTITNYLSLALVKQARGEAREAQLAVDTAKQISERTKTQSMIPIIISFFQTRLWLQQGKISKAKQWGKEYQPLSTFLEERGLDPKYHHHLLETEGILLARLQLSLGDWEKALRVLDPLLEAARNLNRKGRVIEILILQALAFWSGSESERASKSLYEALILAEPQGYIRMFVDEGEPMRELLTLLLDGNGNGDKGESEVSKKYINRLLTEIIAEKTGNQVTQELSSAGLIEPLSNRELEVLRYLVTRLTSTEIARELCISPNTTRFHIKNIYAKLGVHRRSDAVNKAKQIRLL